VNRNVTVDARLAANVRPIRGDPTQLQQVILNLVMNACDAMASLPRHERVLEVRTEAAEGGVRVVVSDRGSGIPAETLAGIFMPFVTTKKHGLGLGLAVCNSIIASHGGEIKAANNADRGAAFTFFLHAEAETETVQ
jgi:C4-dicarboxylate-specific signal transduction histidine kinase